MNSDPGNTYPAAPAAAAEWATRPERGSTLMLRIMVWVSLHLGRTFGRFWLYPIAAYFLLAARHAREASRQYLRRALKRDAGWTDIFRHYLSFASTIHDRVYLIDGRFDLFDFRISGEDVVREAHAQGGGAFLMGAHLGSFEVARAIGRSQPDLRVAMVMYEENARKLNAILAAIDPALVHDIVALGRVDSMLKVNERLNAGEFIGMLGDRTLGAEPTHAVEFLGAPARLPLGPFKMAAMLRRPLILMVGLYRGGNRYDVHFERLADFSTTPPGARQAAVIVGDRALCSIGSSTTARSRRTTGSTSSISGTARMARAVAVARLQRMLERAPRQSASTRRRTTHSSMSNAACSAARPELVEGRTVAAGAVRGSTSSPRTAGAECAASSGVVYGRRGAALRALIFACLAALLLPGGIGAADWGVAQLMRALAQNKSGHATFVEKKFIAVLDRPVESSGELLFVAPHRLEKKTLKPKPESMVLERDMLTLERGAQKRSLRLADYPEIGAFVESIRATLAGDLQALERTYHIGLEGSAERWQLVLVPADAKLAALVTQIRISGTHREVNAVEIRQADGDRSVMTIEKADPS